MTPTQKALERIEECQRTRSTKLDLSGLGLTELPSKVVDLVWLEELDLSSSHGYPSIKNFIKEFPENTNKLSGLLTLNISHCSFNNLENLVSLPQLQTLDCSSNQLTGLSGLSHVPQLQTLDCSNNQLTGLSELSHVPQLQTLHCRSNQLTGLSELSHVPQLQTLDCSGNQLAGLSELSHVPQLQMLYCWATQLTDLSGLSHVPQLQLLDCSLNQLTGLSELSYVPKLQQLDCSHNQILDITDLYTKVVQRRFQGLQLFGNPIIGLPPVVLGSNDLDDCQNSLRNYLTDLDKGHQKQRQIKLQLVGNGRVGKTTLAYGLEHRQAPPEAFKSTHGIVIKEIQQTVDGQSDPVTLQLWDFGGQEIYHSTHRLFLSNDCLYLLLWAEETEECQEEKRHPVSYWLESLRDLSPDSSVILVKNQIDRSDLLPTRPEGLSQDLPGAKQIEDEVKISAMKYQRMPRLRGAIESVLEKLAYRVCLDLPNSWLTVQAEIKELESQRTLPFARFKQLCIKAGVSDAEWFVDYLHKSGLLFYQKGAFQDQIILDQNWVIEAIYTLFDPNKPFRASIEGMLGKFSGLQSSMFWPEVEQAEHEIYLSFMRNCSICYEPDSHDQSDQSDKLLSERQLVLPALLPEVSSVKAAWGEPQENEWVLKIVFPFLHRSVIERMIIALGVRWSGDPWRHGIFCGETPYGQVLMEACYTDTNESNKGYLRFNLRQHRRDETVYALRELVNDSSPHNRYQEFLQQGADPEKELPKFEKRDDRRTEVVAKSKTVNLFISYSHDDEIGYKDELEKCLKAIKRKLPLEYWVDREMFAGDLVNETILERLEAADIVVLLISRNFFASDYCFNIEMEAALKRFEEKKNVVIPVIIKHTDDWHDFEIGKITALPKDGKPLSDWSDPDAFWADVQKGIRRQVEKLLG